MPEETTTTTEKTEEVSADQLTDDEVNELIEDQNASDDAGEKKKKDGDGDTKDAAPVVDPEDAAFLALRKLGVSAQDLVKYAKKGWDYEQVLAATKAGEAEKLTESAKDTKEADSKGGKPEYMTREEHVAAVKEMEQRMAVTASGAHAQARLGSLLDQNGFSELDDPIGRNVIAQATIRSMSQGGNLEASFREAHSNFVGYLAANTRKAIKGKIAARSAAGSSGSGEAPTVTIPDDTVHKASDLYDGTAQKEAEKLMAQLDKAKGRRR